LNQLLLPLGVHRVAVGFDLVDQGVDYKTSANPFKGSQVISLVLDLLPKSTERLKAALQETDGVL
jgi:hypothetical protein